MSTPKPQKHHSRLLNLLLMAGLLWGAFTLSATSHYPPAIKMFAAYVSWGMMIYLLMGFFFARKPPRTIALLGGIAALGAELGHFDLTSMAISSADMPIFMAVIMFVSFISYSLGILAGWLVESLLKGFWRLMSAKPVEINI